MGFAWMNKPRLAFFSRDIDLCQWRVCNLEPETCSFLALKYSLERVYLDRDVMYLRLRWWWLCLLYMFDEVYEAQLWNFWCANIPYLYSKIVIFKWPVQRLNRTFFWDVIHDSLQKLGTRSQNTQNWTLIQDSVIEHYKDIEKTFCSNSTRFSRPCIQKENSIAFKANQSRIVLKKYAECQRVHYT